MEELDLTDHRRAAGIYIYIDGWFDGGNNNAI